MKCKFCERTSEPYIVSYRFSYGLVYTEIKCPRCCMIQETKWSDNKKDRGWKSVGEIIKSKYPIKSL